MRKNRRRIKMKSPYEIVYDAILQNIRAWGWVDRDRFWRTLGKMSIAPKCVDDALKTLEKEGMLKVWPTDEIQVIGWRCLKCGGFVTTLLTSHADDCLERQEKLWKMKREQASGSRAMTDGTSLLR
jgi:hypothetical protein